MSSFALAYSPSRVNPRRAHALRSRPVVPARRYRPWSEVSVAGATVLQAIGGHPPHIKRPQLALLIAAALVLHAGVAWYFSQHLNRHDIEPRKTELNIELVRPPKPVEPPKIEPPKSQPQKPVPKQAQVLPQIQQSDPLPASVGEASEAPIAVAPIVAAPPAPESLPVTAPIGRAGYLNNPPPEYPPQAVRQGWQGNVLLRVHVLSDGKVDSVEIKQSSGRRLLDDEAIRTVKRWLFTPSKRGDTPVDGWATVPIEFLLDQ